MRLVVPALVAALVVVFGCAPHPARVAQGTPLVNAFLLGGSAWESIRGVTVGPDGSIYVTGGTDSPDFPVTEGAWQRVPGTTVRGAAPAISPVDVFVTKFDRDGRLVWSTLLGGPSYDRAYAIDLDAAGNVYVAGRAGAGFPVTTGALLEQFPGGSPNGPYPSQAGFVAKLSPDGQRLLFSTYFGAGDDPSHPIRDLAVDAAGDVLIATSSSTGRFPPALRSAFERGVQPARAGGKDLVVAKLRTDGSALLWATYLGGSGPEGGEPSIRVDGRGDVLVFTTTESADAPTTAGAYARRYGGKGDFYLAKIAGDGSRLRYATYLGGSGEEIIETHHLAVDREGNAVIAASTDSRDFPVTAGAWQPRHAGGLDVVVAKVSADGARLLAATYLGGRDEDHAEGMGVDRDGNVYVSGGTQSRDFPVTPDAAQSALRGSRNFFVARLGADLRTLRHATYLGGRGNDFGRAAAVHPSGVFHVAGEVGSTDWPVRDARGSRRRGIADGGLASFDFR